MSKLQRQHYLPQVYLRQWGDRLCRHRRVGPEGRLVTDVKSPKSIGYVPGLYTIPEGGRANGLAHNELEARFATWIDNRFHDLAHRIDAPGTIEDDDLKTDLLHWMQVLSIRGPQTIDRVQRAMSSLMEENRPTIASMAGRALTPKYRAELQQYLHPFMPRVSALAGLDAFITKDIPSDVAWRTGDVHVVRWDAVEASLSPAGLHEFVTFDNAVVEWATERDDAPFATFSMSPTVLIVVARAERHIDPSAYANLALHHLVNPIPFRKHVIASRRVDGGEYGKCLLNLHIDRE